MADILRIIASILIPPLGVFLQVGLGLHFWISLILTISVIGYPIALAHAIYVIVTR